MSPVQAVWSCKLALIYHYASTLISNALTTGCIVGVRLKRLVELYLITWSHTKEALVSYDRKRRWRSFQPVFGVCVYIPSLSIWVATGNAKSSLESLVRGFKPGWGRWIFSRQIPVLSLIPSFSLSDVLCVLTDLIWRKGTPFEAMAGRTTPSSDRLLAEVFWSFHGFKANARKSVHCPQDHFIATRIIGDRRTWLTRHSRRLAFG